MVVANTTFLLNQAIADECKAWVCQSYAPSALKSGALAEQSKLFRILWPVVEAETVSYAYHATFHSYEDARKWCEGVGGKLREKMTERWGEQALSFHTYFEEVDSYE